MRPILGRAGAMIRADSRLSLRRWFRREGASALVLGIALAAGVLAGGIAAQGRVEIAMAIAGGVFGVATLRSFSVVTWCLMLLITTVAMRGVVTALGLPQAFDFLHYPVAAGFGIAALLQPCRPASRRPAAWLLGLLALSALSMLANGSHPLRMAVFIVIVGEPLLVVWALSRFGIGDRDRRRIGMIAVVLAAVQLPIALVQIAGANFGDPVQGTLAGHGAGAHVLGALFALALLIATAAMSARVVAVRTALVAGGVALAMMLATGSMAITVLTALVAPFVPLFVARGAPGPAGRSGARGALLAAVAGIILAVAALSLAEAMVPSIYQRADRLITEEEFPEIQMLAERSNDPGMLLFGSGPGTSASRASILLISAEEQGSPLAALGLEPTEDARRIAATTRAAGGGTAESAGSSALAIIGDLGVLGFVGLAVLFLRIWITAGSSPDPLAPAVRGALVLVAALIFVDSWLEYPEFAVPLAILVGIVLGTRSDDVEIPDPTLDTARGAWEPDGRIPPVDQLSARRSDAGG
jgi:hypothetical protein